MKKTKKETIEQSRVKTSVGKNNRYLTLNQKQIQKTIARVNTS